MTFLETDKAKENEANVSQTTRWLAAHQDVEVLVPG